MQPCTLLVSPFPKLKEAAALISSCRFGSKVQQQVVCCQYESTIDLLIDFCKFLQKSRTPVGVINQLGVG